jgi:hypothetical protein
MAYQILSHNASCLPLDLPHREVFEPYKDRASFHFGVDPASAKKAFQAEIPRTDTVRKGGGKEDDDRENDELELDTQWHQHDPSPFFVGANEENFQPFDANDQRADYSQPPRQEPEFTAPSLTLPNHSGVLEKEEEVEESGDESRDFVAERRKRAHSQMAAQKERRGKVRAAHQKEAERTERRHSGPSAVTLAGGARLRLGLPKVEI